MLSIRYNGDAVHLNGGSRRLGMMKFNQYLDRLFKSIVDSGEMLQQQADMKLQREGPGSFHVVVQGSNLAERQALPVLLQPPNLAG